LISRLDSKGIYKCLGQWIGPSKLTLWQECGIGVSTSVWTWNGSTFWNNASIQGNTTNKTNTLLCYTKEKITINQAKKFGKVTPNLSFLKKKFHSEHSDSTITSLWSRIYTFTKRIYHIILIGAEEHWEQWYHQIGSEHALKLNHQNSIQSNLARVPSLGMWVSAPGVVQP
jgi:hypothetical protein